MKSETFLIDLVGKLLFPEKKSILVTPGTVPFLPFYSFALGYNQFIVQDGLIYGLILLVVHLPGVFNINITITMGKPRSFMDGTRV